MLPKYGISWTEFLLSINEKEKSYIITNYVALNLTN